MDDTTRLTSAGRALRQVDQGLYFAPIRHHSPACAWAVQQLIRDVRPAHVLIEAPIDLQPHIELLLAADTAPPVALAVFVERKEQSKLAAYYPFCAHSPEYVALVEGRRVDAALEFIDLPSADKAMLASPAGHESIVVDDEAYFDSGDFVAAMCAKAGCRNGFELWDHLFESRLGTEDWQGLLSDVGAYCAALRESTSHAVIEAHGDVARESHMANAITAALEKAGPVVVVTGGFHTPALVEAVAKGHKVKAASEPATSDSYLIRYGFEALDALSGYGAGLPQPGYYDYLWQRAKDSEGAPQWSATALDLLSEFCRVMRDDGITVSLPAQVEALRVADTLAAMRGRRGAARYDLIDAVRTALVKEEIGAREIWTERLLEFLRGNAIGDIPSSAGSPPIVEDARSRAKRLKIDVSDGSRRTRRLDIRRKPAHLRASRFFHAMALLDTKFAERQTGPDFVNNINTGRLFEEWVYAWSPTVEGKLIESAVLGDSVTSACVGLIHAHKAELREAGRSRDIVALTDLFIHGILAGVSERLGPFLQELAQDIQTHADFSAVVQTLRRLHNIASAAGPLEIHGGLDLAQVQQAAFMRLIYLCDDLPKTPKDAIQERIESMRLMMELLRGPGAEVFDRRIFDEAVNRVADAAPPPEILGSVLAISHNAGLRSAGDICAALSGSFTGTVDEEKDRIGVLRGLLTTTPELLWRSEEILKETDGLICGLDEAGFLDLLPHIRLAFTSLNPREADRIAGSLSRIHGGHATEFLDSFTQLSESDLEQGLAIERTLQKSLDDDGLVPWLEAQE